jgi:hypothetical protein
MGCKRTHGTVKALAFLLTTTGLLSLSVCLPRDGVQMHARQGESVGVFARGKRWSGNAPQRKRWRFRPWKTMVWKCTAAKALAFLPVEKLKWKRTAAKAQAFSPVENAGVETHCCKSVGIFARGKRWSGNALLRKRWRFRPWKMLE